MQTSDFHSAKLSELYKHFDSNPAGLSTKEAAARLAKDGPNELPRKKRDSFLKIFLRQLIEPMELLLIAAMLVSFLIGEFVDALAILVIILADVIMGAIQEWNAGKTAEGLAQLIRVKVQVLRDGQRTELDSRELVPGDIVMLESGNKISADLRLIECTNLQIDESILTGESIAVYKSDNQLSSATPLAERSNMAYAGTNVLTGRARALVVATGLDTEVGKITDTVANTTEAKSPLTIRMEKFSKQISLIIVIIGAIVATILFTKGDQLGTILVSVIALAVSAMPEGLPLALTMALTIASNRMSKQNVVVKRLNAVESLGSCTVIASDKTGTLTVNEQTAKRIVLPSGDSYYVEGTGYNNIGRVIPDIGSNLAPAKLLAEMAALNTEAKFEERKGRFITAGDSIDIAFLALAAKLELPAEKPKILSRIPYESENKYSAVFFEQSRKKYCSVKGSLEVVLDFCHDAKIGDKLIPLNRSQIEQQNEELSREGYRVIALAAGETDDSFLASSTTKPAKPLHFLGLVAFIDPMREEAQASIEECHRAGIEVIMITGDHPLTAFSIAKDLGIASDYSAVTTGPELDKQLAKGKKSFDAFIKTKRVFTRITPLGKLEIVKSLQRQGEFVAVTGDGVNDAPALKAANIGVAMGSGTDVAKETADLIILDDNFKSIVAGVREGRNAYANIRKVSYMLLACGFAEVLFFCLAILGDMPMPLVAIQLIWLNIVTDGLQDFALSFEKAEPDIMEHKPRPPEEPIFNKTLAGRILVAGLTMGLIVFAVWLYLIKGLQMEVTTARGYVIVLMVFMQNMHVLNCRSEDKSAFALPLKTNLWVPATIVGAILLQIIVSEVPVLSNILQTTSIPAPHLLILFLLAISVIITTELYKRLPRHRRKTK